MKRILILLLLTPLAYKAIAQQTITSVDTVLVGSVEKNCPGGFEAFNKYIMQNTHPAGEALYQHKMGTTYVSFIIEPDGSASNVCTILPAGYGMDQEAIRVIGNSNNWIPATINNKPVRCFCRAAIKFYTDFDKRVTSITAKRID